MRKENILMKEKKYYDLVSSFSELDLEDKKEEVLKHTLELLQLLYLKNKNYYSVQIHVLLIQHYMCP